MPFVRAGAGKGKVGGKTAIYSEAMDKATRNADLTYEWNTFLPEGNAAIWGMEGSSAVGGGKGRGRCKTKRPFAPYPDRQ